MTDCSGWISVKDRLPETDDEVLMYTSWGGYYIGRYSYHEPDVWSSEEIYAYDDGEISYWMPLPEPPKEE